MRTALVLALLAGLPASEALGAPQAPGLVAPELDGPQLGFGAATRVFDPKLDDAFASFELRLETPGATADATLEVRRQGALVATLWSGELVAGERSVHVRWKGREASGARCDTGRYELVLSGAGCRPATRGLDIVRLGVTEIEAQDSPAGDDEFQMVYFMKGAGYAFYATPAVHEYKNVAPPTGGSELDLNNAEPRPSVAPHDSTASPALSGSNYNTSTHNYPLAYIRGARPRLELRFGASGTSAHGGPMGVGYPLANEQIRVRCDQGDVLSGWELVTPSGFAVVDLPPLPSNVQRVDTSITLRFEHRGANAPAWRAIPGSVSIPLRFYTLLATPRFRPGAPGVQHSGPWVEVVDYVASWSATLGVAITDQASLTEAFIKGFFGQNGGIATALEGVKYDAPSLGGNNGSTHYFQFSSWRMNLSRLLNNHALGVYVNCSDNMGASTTMLSMIGALDVKPARLGPMSLRAIWGIGAPDYTLDLWSSGNHGFSYHHIVTDDASASVSDTCLQLDEDGEPSALPGTPGWNVRRAWLGAEGYRALSSSNTPSITVETLPGLL